MSTTTTAASQEIPRSATTGEPVTTTARRNRMGIWMCIVSDATGTVALLISYVYLWSLNVNSAWAPPKDSFAPDLPFWLIVAGIVLAAAVARLVIGWPTGAAPAVVLMVAAALVAIGVLGGLVVVNRSIPETLSNWIGRIRLIALAAAIPLCIWATGLFGAIRDIPFR